MTGMRPQPLAHLRDSAHVLRRHPVVFYALGVALLLSLGAVCCGLGLIAAPWLACELSGLQLELTTGDRRVRTASWLGAAFLQLTAIVVMAVGATLAATALHVTPAPLDGAQSASGPLLVLLAVGGATIVLSFMAPFVLAPLILVDRGGSVGSALVESARISMTGGLLAHVGLSLCAHAVQVLPAVIVLVVVSVMADFDSVPLAMTAALPLMGATIPLGQGMIVSAYAARRSPAPATERREGVAPLPLALSLGAVASLPVVAVLLVAASIVVRPARPSPGAAPAGELVTDHRIGAADPPRTIHLPDTTVSVIASPTRVEVVASDGGGAGQVPLAHDAPVVRVRAVRVRDAFAVELTSADGRASTVWVDRAGVRLDDHPSARLADHAPPLSLLLVGFALLLASWLVAWGVTPLGEVRRRAGTAPEERPGDGRLAAEHARAVRRAWAVVALAGGAALAALWVSLLALGVGGV